MQFFFWSHISASFSKFSVKLFGSVSLDHRKSKFYFFSNVLDVFPVRSETSTLTLSGLKSLSYRNQSIDLHWKQWTGFYMKGISVMKECIDEGKWIERERRKTIKWDTQVNFGKHHAWFFYAFIYFLDSLH